MLPLAWIKPLHRFLILLVLIIGTSLAYAEYVNDDIYDPKSSRNKSGVNTPREYYIPPNPPYEKIDPKEFADYHKTYYSPYAQLQVPRPIQIGNVRLREGYYLVKLDVVDPPPRPLNLSPPSSPSVDSQPTPPNTSLFEKAQTVWPWQKNEKNEVQNSQKRKFYPAVHPDVIDPYERPQVSLLLKQMGSVEVVIPVYTSEPLAQPIKKGSTVQLVITQGDPVIPEVVYLKYCVRQLCYRSAPLKPGLVQ